MAFKPFAAIVALALLAAAPLPQTSALSVGHGDPFLVSRVPHTSLTVRQKGAKRCAKYRSGETVKTTTKETSKTTQQPPKSTAKPTSTSTAQPKPTSFHASSKLGFIYPADNPEFYAKAKASAGGKIFGTYTWNAWKPDGVSAEDFIATFWGYKTIGEWDQVKRGYAYRAFGCNEVNHGEQSKMEPSEGVTLWKKYLSPLKNEGYTLYSHSVANGPSGLAWWDKYFELCSSCKDETTAMNVHYYSNNPQGMIDWLETVHTRYGLPIVVSEFACSNWSGDGPVNQDCDAAGVKNFIEVTTNYMKSKSWVLGFLYFGQFTKSNVPGGVPQDNALYTESGSFTEAGKAYTY